jgi:outer membrane immunogenic protein
MERASLAWAIGAIRVLAQPAVAADVGGPVYAPGVAPAFSWTGIYAGVNIGDGSAKHKTRIFSSTIDFGVVNGVIGGGQIGANWQVGSLVLGAEADGQGSSQSKTATTAIGAVNITEDYRKPGFATFRSRAGWAFADRWLIYATGGGAWLDSNVNLMASTGGGFNTSSGFELSHFGWTAGGGVEGAITRNWSWKVEYLYLQTGKFSTTVNVFGFVGLWNARLTENIGRIGINYRF